MPYSFAERKCLPLRAQKMAANPISLRLKLACILRGSLFLLASKPQAVHVQSTAQDHATLGFKYLASSLELSAGASAVRLPEARAHTVLL